MLSFDPLLVRAGLHFQDPEAEGSFHRQYFVDYTMMTRVMGLLGILLIFLFYLWDEVIDPERAVFTRTFRTFGLVPVVVLVLALSFTDLWKRWGEHAITFVLCWTVTGVIGILAFLETGLEYGAAGIVLVVFFAFVAFRVRFAYYVVFSAVTILGLNLALAVAPGIQPVIVFVDNMFVVSACALGLLSSALHERAFRERFLWEQEVVRERARAEAILYSLLPAQVAQRVKRGEAPIADALGEVTIVFADLAGFTGLATRLAPRHLVETLNELFSEFDQLAAKYGVEKIKTMGDAYMAVSGLVPGREDSHAEDAARLAVEMRVAVDEMARRLEYPLGIRVGLHTGPVIAGVIGSRKPVYDCWGAAVNMASTLEATADVGQIQLSESAYQRLRKCFEIGDRGEQSLKGFGRTRTYYLVQERMPAARAAQPAAPHVTIPDLPSH